MRLTKAVPYRHGITRRRRGRGWSYTGADGAAVTDASVRARIDGLVIPPAWRKVWISERERDHIQAVGYDDAGRRQYLYHPQWEADRAEEKHDRVLALARMLPRFRDRVDRSLTARGTGQERVLGAAMRILDLGVFRTGGEAYAEENGTHGLATLERRHVRMRGSDLEFSYTAKGGLHRRIRIRDEGLTRFTHALRQARPESERFLVHRDGGRWHEVHSDDVNVHFKSLTGDEFTAKDLRTWNATVVAATAFAEFARPASDTARRKAEAAAMRTVADALGNTPTVARSSYVDPRVIGAFGDGVTIADGLRRARAQARSETEMRASLERAVIRLLDRSG